MCHVRTDVHQVGYAPSALPFGITLEQLANLEEQHNEDRLRELRLGTRQEADAQRADGSHRHQEVLVHGVAVSHTLSSLLQRLVAYQQVGYEVDQQQLPRRQRQFVFNDDGNNQ